MTKILLAHGNNTYAEINLSTGATLCKLVLNDTDIIKYPLKDDDPQKGYPSAILFPFPNRIQDGKYSFEGKEYELEINEKENNHAIHGLVAFESFELVKKNKSMAKVKYDYDGSNKAYPFPYVLYITYQLKSNELLMQIEVENSGTGKMPYGFGWHPYFGFNGNSVSQMKIKAPARKKIELNDRYIPTTEFLKEEAQEIELKNTILDNVYHLENVKGKSEVVLSFGDKNLIVSQEAGPNKLNYFVLYTPSTRNCIAIEPQTSNTNCFNNGEGLLVLNEGKKAKFNISVRLES